MFYKLPLFSLKCQKYKVSLLCPFYSGTSENFFIYYRRVGLFDNICSIDIKFSIYSRFKGFTGIDFYNFNSIILLLQLLLLLLLLLQLILVFGGHNNADFLEYYAKYAALFSLLVITSTVC